MVHYRTDGSLGRVGILPATCKRGLHALATVGYRATEPAGGVAGGVVRVSCAACAALPHPDHAWRLATTPPAPAAAELDDRPYAHLHPRFIAQPSRPAPG